MHGGRAGPGHGCPRPSVTGHRLWACLGSTEFREARVADSFVHLHNHTEYSMLDGAAKVGPLFKEAERLGMTAVGMTDHGNMYGASEFYNSAKKHGIKPIIGIEAYVAPESRFTPSACCGATRARSRTTSPAAARTPHDDGRRELDRSAEPVQAVVARVDRGPARQVAAHGRGADRHPRRGHHRHHRLPSGEIQTRLRLGHDREALEAAAKWQEIWARTTSSSS